MASEFGHRIVKPTYIDCRQLEGSGIGTYVDNLIKQYAKLGPDLPIRLLARKEHYPFLKKDLPYDLVHYNDPIYSIREQYRWISTLDRKGMLHVPHYNAPVLYPGSLVTTVHDVCHLAMKQYFPGVLKRIYSENFLQQVLHRSNYVITVSEFSKNEILQYFNVRPEKIRVIPNGVSRDFTPVSELEAERVRRKHRLPEEFLLFLGNVKQHKNILGLVQSYKIAVHEDSSIPPLVVLGQYENLITGLPNLKEIIHDPELQNRLIFTGYLPYADIPAIYSMASLFLFPSFYEGFGLPPLEAMACGTPVIASNVSSIPEVVGDAALMVNPYDVNEIAEKILFLAGSPAEQERLRQRGLEHVKKYTWETSARMHLEVYAEAQERALTPVRSKRVEVAAKAKEPFVLFLDQYGDRIGGGQVILMDILEKFRAKGGWRIMVGLPEEGVFSERLKSMGYDYKIFPIWQPRAPRNNLLEPFRFISHSLEGGKLLLDYVRKNQIDFVYCNGGRTFLMSGIMNLLHRVPTFWHLHTMYNQQQKALVVFLGKMRAVRSIIAVSETVKEQYRSEVVLPKVDLVYNWVSPRLLEEPVLERPERLVEPLRVGVVGLICHVKGQWTVLEAMEEAEEVLPMELHLYGSPVSEEDPEWQIVRERAERCREKGWKIHFEGYVTDPIQIYDHLDLILIPSLFQESFGLIAIEAMSRGVIVAGNDYGALKEVIKHGRNGFLYDVEEKGALMRLIRALLQGEYDLREIRDFGRKEVLERYNPEVQLEMLYGKVRKQVPQYERIRGGA